MSNINLQNISTVGMIRALLETGILVGTSERMVTPPN